MNELEPQTAPQHSTFVTVVAWIFISLSGFATLISILQNIMVWTVFQHEGMDAAQADAASHAAADGIPAPMAWLMGNIELWFGAFLVVCVTTLTVSIGMLLRKNWGRLGFIGVMGLGIAYQVFGLLAMWWMTGSMPAFDDGPAQLGTFMVMMQIFALLISVGMMILFGWIIKRLRSPEIRAEFTAV